jgi:hypothetical protein
MSNYDPTISPLKYLQTASVGMTQYEFDTFIVGKHHTRARLIQDLLRRKQNALDEIEHMPLTLRELDQAELKNLIRMIDIELSQHDINNIKDLESEEIAYWIDELARTSALEINTFGRIKPETMDKLMLIEEDHFISAMNKAGMLVMKLKLVAEGSHCIDAPLSKDMPRT